MNNKSKKKPHLFSDMLLTTPKTMACKYAHIHTHTHMHAQKFYPLDSAFQDAVSLYGNLDSSHPHAPIIIVI